MAALAIPVTAHDHLRGPAEARLTLVLYGDFQCPHCALFHPCLEEAAHELRDLLQVAYRHFPLADIHPRAPRAAEAAEADASQERFWEMTSLLYANHERLDDDSLVRYAKKLNLDPRRFRKELGSGVHAPRVRSDYLGGLRSGVKGTPMMFINGEPYMGKLDLGDLVGTLLTVARRTAR